MPHFPNQFAPLANRRFGPLGHPRNLQDAWRHKNRLSHPAVRVNVGGPAFPGAQIGPYGEVAVPHMLGRGAPYPP